jgi:hypothetical protein
MSLCLHVSMCPCLHVYMSTCLHVSKSPCLQVSMFPSIHVSMSQCLLVFMSSCLHVSMSLCLHVSRKMENGTNRKQSHPFVFCEQKTDTGNFCLLASKGNVKRTFDILGQQMKNGNRRCAYVIYPNLKILLLNLELNSAFFVCTPYYRKTASKVMLVAYARGFTDCYQESKITKNTFLSGEGSSGWAEYPR